MTAIWSVAAVFMTIFTIIVALFMSYNSEGVAVTVFLLFVLAVVFWGLAAFTWFTPRSEETRGEQSSKL